MIPRCAICGGSAGDPRQLENGGAHNLCRARRAGGQPTPSLGERCPVCHGRGRTPVSSLGPINPTQRDLDAWAPPCGGCDGRGVVR